MTSFWLTIWALTGLCFWVHGFSVGANRIERKLFKAQDKNKEWETAFEKLKRRNGMNLFDKVAEK